MVYYYRQGINSVKVEFAPTTELAEMIEKFEDFLRGMGYFLGGKLVIEAGEEIEKPTPLPFGGSVSRPHEDELEDDLEDYEDPDDDDPKAS